MAAVTAKIMPTVLDSIASKVATANGVLVTDVPSIVAGLAAVMDAEISEYIDACRDTIIRLSVEDLVGNWCGHVSMHEQVVLPALRRAVKAGDRVLDFACGPGRVSKLLCDDLGCRTVGVDIGWPGLACAAQAVPRALFMLLSGGGDLPFPPETFDAVVSVVALQHIQFFPVRHRYCQEFARVLRPGGRLLLQVNADASGEHIRWFERGVSDRYMAPDVVCDEEEIRAYLHEAVGLKVAETWRTAMDTAGVSWLENAKGLSDGWLWVLAVKPE